MSKPPFEFDIRVSSDKQRRKTMPLVYAGQVISGISEAAGAAGAGSGSLPAQAGRRGAGGWAGLSAGRGWRGPRAGPRAPDAT